MTNGNPTLITALNGGTGTPFNAVIPVYIEQWQDPTDPDKSYYNTLAIEADGKIKAMPIQFWEKATNAYVIFKP